MDIEILNKLKDIKFNQPKYILPAMLYPAVLIAGYFLSNALGFEAADKTDPTLETTDYLNANIAQAKSKSSGIGSKIDNMYDQFGKEIRDATAIDNISEEDEKKLEEYNSQYSEEELNALNQQMLERDLAAAEAARKAAEEEAAKEEQKPKVQTYEDLQKLFAEAQKRAEEKVKPILEKENLTQESTTAATKDALPAGAPEEVVAAAAAAAAARQSQVVGKEKNVAPGAVRALDDNSTTYEMVKITSGLSPAFNSISRGNNGNKLIRAIIDEEIKVQDNSRVRLRLLDDVAISGVVIRKGFCLYATVSGIGNVRLKGSISSVMVEDELIKLNLAIYDMDGQEGLYVPENSLRETTQDITSGALSSGLSINNSSTTSSAAVYAMSVLQNAVSKTTSAVSKAIKKSKVHLKYGTMVYLVNTNEKSDSKGTSTTQNVKDLSKSLKMK